MISLILFAAMMQGMIGGGVGPTSVDAGGTCVAMCFREGERVECPGNVRMCGGGKWEPMDVPAISEEYVAFESSENCRRPKGIYETKCKTVATGWACSIVQCDTVKHKGTRETCADKSRILLTAEDGDKHCIKFPTEKP